MNKTMSGARTHNKMDGQELMQDPEDGSLFHIPPGPQSTGIHPARSGHFYLL